MNRTTRPAVTSSETGPNPNLLHLIQLQGLTRRLEAEGKRPNQQVTRLRASIPSHLLRSFDHAAQHGRAAVAKVSDSGVCENCHLKLPSGVAPTVHVFNAQVDKCPNCGCFIFLDSELKQAGESVPENR